MTNSSPSSTPPSSRPRPALVFTALFAFLGFADAAYLTADHYFALPVPCGLTGGCEAVLTSPYSMIGPIPLAALGAAYYLLALFLAVYIYTSERPEAARRAVLTVFALSGIGVLASAYYMYVQVFVIEALCVYCLGSALTSTLIFISSSVLAFRKKGVA